MIRSPPGTSEKIPRGVSGDDPNRKCRGPHWQGFVSREPQPADVEGAFTDASVETRDGTEAVGDAVLIPTC